MTKSEYKKRHLKVVEYIYREYGDLHFNKTRSGSLLIQLAPIDKHEFHLLIKTFASDGSDSINNIAHNVVNVMYKSMYNITKDEYNAKRG
jgi:hypothetical protein